MIGWIIALVVVAGLSIAGGIGWSRISKEHREARSLPLNAVDFGKLNDGTYHGAYAGGMYKWRANECQVTVSSGNVTDIRLVEQQRSGWREYAAQDSSTTESSMRNRCRWTPLAAPPSPPRRISRRWKTR